MTDDDKDKPTTPVTDTPEKTKSRKLWLLLLIVLVLGSGAAGGAFWWTRRGGDAGGTDGKGGHAAAAHSGLVTLQEFTVNLADQNVSRFLRTTINLVVDDEARAAEVQEEKLVLTRLRSAVLEVLSQQMADQVVTPEGKAALKKAIIDRTSPVLAPNKVIDVLFSDFVVQF